jgi:MPBQ/MSBQ methyltransferase
MALWFLLPQAGDSPLQLGPKAEERGKVAGNPISFLLRLLLGTTAGFYYFLVRGLPHGAA